MKTGLNVLAVVVCLVWAGAYYVRELGRAYGNGSGDGEIGSAVVLLISLAVLVSVVAARRSEGERSWVLTALPFVLVSAGQVFLGLRPSSAQSSRDAEQESRAGMVQARFDEIPAHFRHRGGFGELAEQLDSILVIDADSQSIVRVDHERESLVAVCVGRIDGTTLQLVDDTNVRDYTDDAGRTVYDRFTVVPGDGAGRSDCDYERYSF